MAPRTPRSATVLPTPQASELPPDNDFPEDDDEQDALGDLAFFSDATDEVTWAVERYKTADEVRANPRGKNRVFVTTIDGKVNIVAFQREHGGGVFKFEGRFGNGTFYGRRKIELSGPRIDYNALPAPAAPVVIPRSNGHAPDDDALRMRRMMRRMMREIQELKTRPAQPANVVTAPAPPPMTLETVFQFADKIASRSNPPQDPVDKVAEALLRGIDIGTAREPASAAEGTDWISVVKEFAPVLRDLVGAMAETARARAGRPAGPAPAARGPAPAPPRPSGTFDNVPEAVVVETMPAQPAQPAPPADSHRWLTAIESIAQSIADGEDPRDFTFTLSRILSAQELALLRFASPNDVMARLAPYAGQLQVLGTPEARAFVTAVLAELKNPTEDGTEAGQ